MSLSVAVVTISDSSANGTRQDRSGPAVTARLRELGYHAADPEIVPDERSQIADLLRRLADSSRYQAIFTTGGTGITARDVTPEATRDILDREIPASPKSSASKAVRKSAPLPSPAPSPVPAARFW